MGQQLFDQYTYLHFCVGVVVYFWGVKLSHWIVLHVMFELVENSTSGMHFINNYLPFWPGKKPAADRPINILGDNIGAIAGWLSAYGLDYLGQQQGWYDMHIQR